MNKCLILIGYRDKLFDSSDLTPLDSYLWVWMKIEVSKHQVKTQDEMLAAIFDPAFHIKRH
jgi:hypothetical protein